MFLKKGIEAILLVCTVAVFMSCSSNSQLTEETAVETNVNAADLPLQGTTEESIRETTWQEFKAAIKSKDEEKLKACCTPEITDYEALFFMLNELYVMRKMDETQCKDLEYVEVDGKEYLQFYAEEIGEDEYGYEYATAITLHFIVVEESLFLDHYSAAG
ncbi:MAG: hypothetical protein GQ574_19130 [Crocinitomix sp.]|nr:hypothetical protein [Crocinitomix sp.]